MHVGDVMTLKLKKTPSGSFMKVFEQDWLLFIGFTKEDLEKEELDVVFKGEQSAKHGHNYIGFGRPIVKKEVENRG